MSHQFQVIPAATVGALNDTPVGDVQCTGYGSDSSYSTSSELVNNQYMLNISPLPGAVLPIGAYPGQQVFLLSDGIQQQDVCTIAMQSVGGAISQYVPQPVVFGAQSTANNDFYYSAVPIADAGWPQGTIPAIGNVVHQNLVEQPQNSIVNDSNTTTTKGMLVMLPTGEQRFVEMSTNSCQVAGNVPAISQAVEQMFDKAVNRQRAEVKPVVSEQPDIEEIFEKRTTRNGMEMKPAILHRMGAKTAKETSPHISEKNTRLHSPPSDEIIALTEVKRDPLEDCIPEEEEQKPELDDDGMHCNCKPARRINSNDEVEVLPLSNVGERPNSAEQQEVPKYLEVMAVCNNCGYTSIDFNKCQRCRKKLPAVVKTVPIGNYSQVVDAKIPTSKLDGSTRTTVWTPCKPEKPLFVKAALMKQKAGDQSDVMAVCSHCGYTSIDINFCERCRRGLPHNVKLVLTPKISKKS